MPRKARVARDGEEWEIREKMAKGITGEGYIRSRLRRELWRIGGPREAGRENSLYLFTIDREHENRPQNSF